MFSIMYGMDYLGIFIFKKPFGAADLGTSFVWVDIYNLILIFQSSGGLDKKCAVVIHWIFRTLLSLIFNLAVDWIRSVSW